MSLKLINFFLRNINKVKITRKHLKAIKLKYYITFNFLVRNILSIIFKYSNSFLYVQNSIGKNDQFFSIKAKNKNKKFKNLKNEILKQCYKILLFTAKINKGTFTIIHFYNIKFNYKWFITKLYYRIFIISIKFFKNICFNGCKRKKLKRKQKKWPSGLRRQTVNLLIYST